MAEEEAKPEGAEGADAAGKKGGGVGGMIVGAVVTFVACLGAVVAGGYVNGMLHPAAHDEGYVLGKDGRITPYIPPPPKDGGKAKDPKKANAPALFYTLDPPLVVNFDDSSAVRFLQVGIDIMARDQLVLDAVAKHVPLIRNNLLLLISNRDFKKLMTREGKEELRKEALGEVKKIIKKETGEADIEDLLFTSFVVQ